MERKDHTPTRERKKLRGGSALKPPRNFIKNHIFFDSLWQILSASRQKWDFYLLKNDDFLTATPLPVSTFTGSQVSQRFTVTGVRWHFWNALGFSEFTFGGFLFCSFTWGSAQIFPYNYMHPKIITLWFRFSSTRVWKVRFTQSLSPMKRMKWCKEIRNTFGARHGLGIQSSKGDGSRVLDLHRQDPGQPGMWG